MSAAMMTQEQALAEGKVPFRVRVGVTGHRHLDAGDAVRIAVREAIDRILELCAADPATPVLLTAVSPLAEGADRVVAAEVLMRPGGTLEAPLPLPLHDYLKTFDGPSGEFDLLLDRAEMTTELPPSPALNDAFARVGQYVVDHCDVLIAIWDGRRPREEKRGGTADIVRYARDVQVPMIWVHTEPVVTWSEERTETGIAARTLAAIDAYNALRLPAREFEDSLDAHKRLLVEEAKRVDLDPIYLARFSDWISPFYVRADAIAKSFQRRYNQLRALIVLVALMSVGAAAVAASLGWSERALAGVEFGTLLALGVLGLLGRRLHLHDRWIAARMLSERCRSALFLAITGLAERKGASLEGIEQGHGIDLWLRRTFTEIWQRRPRTEPLGSLDSVKRYLIEVWLHDQISYFGRRTAHNMRTQKTWAAVVVGLWALTVVFAGLRVLDLWRDIDIGLTVHNWLSLAGLFVPAVAAGITALLAKAELQRNAEHYARMTQVLSEMAARLLFAATFEEVQRVAAEAEEALMAENQQWFGVMKFHDFALQG